MEGEGGVTDPQTSGEEAGGAFFEPWISVTYRGGIERFKERNERVGLKMFPRRSSSFPPLVSPRPLRTCIYIYIEFSSHRGVTRWRASLEHIDLAKEFLRAVILAPFLLASLNNYFGGFANL